MGWNNPIVAGENLVISGIRSQDYKEAESGWRVTKEGKAQFSNLQLLGDIGATGSVSADQFIVGDNGLWLPNDENLLDRLEANRWDANEEGPYPNGPVGPKGYVGYYAGLPTGTFSGSVETGVIAVRFWKEPHRAYLIVPSIRVIPSVTTDSWYLRFRYTTDNTVPTTADTIARVQMLPSTGTQAISHVGPTSWTWRTGAGTSGVCYMGMFLTRNSGTGTATVLTNAENFCDIAIIDIGPNLGVGEGLAAKRGGVDIYTTPGSTYSAPTAPPPASTVTKTYTKTYLPTWSRTFDGDNTVTFDDSVSCYQGQVSSDRGNTRSLVGYNYAQIQADLSGATVNSIKLNFKVKHAYWNVGVNVQIGSHNYTAKPGTWSTSNVVERRVSRANSVAGSSYTVTLPIAFGTEFKSGATRGIAFGPAPDTSFNYYGYLYGATESGKPSVTITYTK